MQDSTLGAERRSSTGDKYPHPQLRGLGCPAYPSDEGGVGERGPHVMELEIVHVVEELCRGFGIDQAP